MIAGDGGPLVNYKAVGSGSGRKAYLDQTVNFGASDDPMIPRDNRKVKRGVVQIPHGRWHHRLRLQQTGL